jgi:hypothetical protein
MIVFNSNYSGLVYTNYEGELVEVLYTDSEKFNDLAVIRDAQLNAADQNLLAKTNYNRTIQNDQISEDASRPYPPPPEKPKMKVITDTGIVSETDFPAGELAVIVPKVATAPSKGIPKVDSGSTAVAQNTVILAQLQLILGALKKAGLL